MKGLALVLILSSLRVRTSCSENVTDCAPCRCQPDVQGTVDVDCSGLGLTELPYNIPNNTAYLGFKYNNLTTLDLDILCKLRLLEGVDLSKNKISSIHGSFSCFEYLSLDLSNNSLETLDRKTFGFSLRWLKQAFLFNNPWKCDCNLLWLKTDMHRYKKKIPSKDVRCQSPSGLEGKLLKDVKPEDFVCHFPFWAEVVIGVAGGLLLVTVGVALGCWWRRKQKKKKRKPTFCKDGCVPTATSLILEWKFEEGYNPATCLVHITGGIVKTQTVLSDQYMDGTWTLQVSEGITCNTEYNVRVTGGTDTDLGPPSDTICLVTVGPGGPRDDNTEYVKDFWIIGHQDDRSRIEKLCKALEKHHDLTGGTDYRDSEGGDSEFDILEKALSTSKIIIVVLSNNTKGAWVKYQIQTVRHCLMDNETVDEEEEQTQTSQRLIPVRLTHCRKPHCLRTLHTFDVWDKYFWRKLLAAFNKDSSNEDDRTNETAPLVQNNVV
ncbi:uncharacterized protein LOC144927421 [Branchiostoma floridae x Branchiostoma belcheri]